MNVREAALVSLIKCEEGSRFSNIEVDTVIKKYGLEGSDRAFYTALVYGSIEKRITLDYIISRFSAKPIEKIECRVLNILRLGAYQIMFLERVPDSAACNESVKLAKLYTHRGTEGFVNGILRNIARNKESIEYPDKGTDEYYSVKYSCPVWLCRMWRGMYGDERTEKMLEGINRNPKVTLRVNTLKTDRDTLIAVLKNDGIECEKTAMSGNGVVLCEYTPISKIKALHEGLCFVQDESSQLCSSSVGAKEGELVIDTCACPGGKTFGMAMDMNNNGRIMSLDLHKSKLSLIEQGAEKLGIDIVSTDERNGALPPQSHIGEADRVLCDVPCSGLGVIAKKPDLRYKSPEDISRLPEIQYSILKSSAAYVKKGGYLVYSTCTVNEAENTEVVRRFLAENSAFAPCTENMPDGKAEITFFPGEQSTDGFFIAKFKRIG